MKNCLAAFIGLVCVGFALSHMHIPAKACYTCKGEDLTFCRNNMETVTCNMTNGTFPDIGEGDCYTAVGWYMMNGEWRSGAWRGCINCTMEDAALQYFKMKFESFYENSSLSLMYSAFSCCNSTNCNNMMVSLPPLTPMTPSVMPSSMTPSSPDVSPTTSDGYVHRVTPFSGILVIVMIAVGLLS